MHNSAYFKTLFDVMGTLHLSLDRQSFNSANFDIE